MTDSSLTDLEKRLREALNTWHRKNKSGQVVMSVQLEPIDALDLLDMLIAKNLEDNQCRTPTGRTDSCMTYVEIKEGLLACAFCGRTTELPEENS